MAGNIVIDTDNIRVGASQVLSGADQIRTQALQLASEMSALAASDFNSPAGRVMSNSSEQIRAAIADLSATMDVVSKNMGTAANNWDTSDSDASHGLNVGAN